MIELDFLCIEFMSRCYELSWTVDSIYYKEENDNNQCGGYGGGAFGR